MNCFRSSNSTRRSAVVGSSSLLANCASPRVFNDFGYMRSVSSMPELPPVSSATFLACLCVWVVMGGWGKSMGKPEGKTSLAHMSELPDDILELQQLAFRYFLDHTNARNGLVADNTREDSACSIAATGLGLSCYPVAVNNGWLKRADAAERVLTALRFFEHSPQGPEPDTTGYKGFYYHFLEMENGRRAGRSELSTVDSAFLLAGMLLAGTFFDADAPVEREI